MAKKIVFLILMAVVLLMLFGCRNGARGTTKGNKAVIWDRQGDRTVLLLIEGVKATTLQAVDFAPENSAKVGDVYDGSPDTPQEMTRLTNAAENKEIYRMDINLGENLKKDAPDIYLVDVRTEEEYRQGHLAEAMLVPLDQLDQRASRDLPDRETPVLVYCRSGNRSAQAAALLKKQGYNLVIDMGGINGYKGNLTK